MRYYWDMLSNFSLKLYTRSRRCLPPVTRRTRKTITPTNFTSGSILQVRKELSCNYNKDHFAHPLQLSPIHLFKLVHFIIFCFYCDLQNYSLLVYFHFTVISMVRHMINKNKLGLSCAKLSSSWLQAELKLDWAGLI